MLFRSVSQSRYIGLTEQPNIQSGRVFITFLEDQSTVIDPVTRLIPFPKTTVDQVSGYLNYSGPPKSLDDFEAAIATGIQEKFNDYTCG